VLTILTLISLMLNLRGVLDGKCSRLFSGGTPGSFIGFGVIAFFVVGVVNILGAFVDINNALNFTWLGRARTLLQVYGFFVMIAFGAIYYLVPAIAGIELCPRLMKLHFRFAAAGVVLVVVPLAIGGLVEAAKIGNASMPFADVLKSTLMFLRLETIGELLLLGGHVVLLLNLAGLAKQLYLTRMEAAYANVTEDLFKSAEAKP
jgi:cytochrome c oxidase cbb3-type subunit 1